MSENEAYVLFETPTNGSESLIGVITNKEYANKWANTFTNHSLRRWHITTIDDEDLLNRISEEGSVPKRNE